MTFDEFTNWANINSGFITILIACISAASVIVTWIFRKKIAKSRSYVDGLGKIEKWRTAFNDYLVSHRAKKVDTVIVIRDVKRKDQYPNTKNENGIAPAFKVWLVYLYHNGIMVSFGMMQITYVKAIEDETNWFYCKDDEPGAIKVFLIGKIPYDRIEEVNWQGDEYYPFPHLYCRFDSKLNEPYEELVYCERIEREMEDPYYREIAKLNDMRNDRMDTKI